MEETIMKKATLSASEWKIMSYLWDHEPVTIMQLTAALKEETGWSKNTIITFLKRMESKNAVSYSCEKNAKHYFTLIKRDEVAVEETKSFLKRMYSGSLGMMMNSLIEQEALSEDDISELREILDKAQSEDSSE